MQYFSTVVLSTLALTVAASPQLVEKRGSYSPVTCLSGVQSSLELGLPSLTLGINSQCSSAKGLSSGSSALTSIGGSLLTSLTSCTSLISSSSSLLTSTTSGIEALGSLTISTITTAEIEEVIDSIQAVVSLFTSIKASIVLIAALEFALIEAKIIAEIEALYAAIALFIAPIEIFVKLLEAASLDTSGLTCALTSLTTIGGLFELSSVASLFASSSSSISSSSGICL